MKLNSFARFFGKTSRRTPRRNPPSRSAKPHVQLLEDRTLLAVLPPAVVSNPTSLANGISPQVVIDPVNPQKVVEVHTTITSGLAGFYSTNAGQTWTSFALPGNTTDPNISNTITQSSFAEVTSPSVAFDRTENFYVVCSEHDATFTSGAIIFNKFSFTGSAPVLNFNDLNHHLYTWFQQDPAYNPVVAVDNNQPTFTDPTTGQVQTDSLATLVNLPGVGLVPKAVYVAWNTNFTEPSGALAPTSSNIMVLASPDGGHHFTTQQYVSDGFASATAPQGSAPEIVFTQGSVDGRVPGGQLTFFWNSTPPLGTLGYAFNRVTMDASQPDFGNAGTPAAATQEFTGTGGNIADASSSSGALNVPGTDYAVHNGPNAIAIGNFFTMGMGNDIVTANFSSGDVSVVENLGGGVYATTPINTPVGAQPFAVVAADFNGDGIDDIAVLNQGSDLVSIYRGTGAGTFTFAETLTAGTNPSALIVSDFNNDTFKDLAVTNAGDGTVSVFLGKGNGTFSAAKVSAVSATPLAASPQDLAAGDLNGDKFADLVTANQGTNEVGVLIGNGNGTFKLGTALKTKSPIAVGLDDVNADGILDLAVLARGGNGSLFLGNGNGTFAAPNAFGTTGPANNLAFGDFNGDGNQDIATTSPGSNVVSVATGNGDGTFAAVTTYFADLRPTALVSQDLNGDGFTDLAVANFNGNDVTVFTGASTTNTPATTLFSLPVNITDPNFSNITDLEVTLNVTHPHLNQLEIVLRPPTGSGLTPIFLLRNQTDASGNTLPQGVKDQANLGMLNGLDVGTVFDDNAPRSITDGTAAAPYIGHFRPELGSLLFGFSSLTKAQVDGTWTLEVTDFQNDTSPIQFVDNWSLHFTGRISTTGFGSDTTVEVPSLLSLTPVTTVTGSPNNVYPLVTAASGTPGIGPGIVAAVDNTLGSFSPYQGRMYVAYTGAVGTDTNIYLISSDDNGFSWSSPVQVNDDALTDNFSEGNRPQFLPSLAVDEATGTVVVSYFDGRWDPSLTRVANSLSASIDGGQTFSPSVLLNTPSTATNAITGQSTFIEPIPGNQGLAGAFGFGDRAGLAVYAGEVYPFFSSNLNAAGASIMTAAVSIAAGPRVVQGDMGPVVADFTAPINESTSNVVTYNNTFASDGTRQLTGFVVTFDRPVDPGSINASDVTVIYRSPETPASEPGTDVLVDSVTPLDGGVLFGPALVGGNKTLATQFLVHLKTPQSAVGTYSYAVGPNVRDRIRTPGVTPVGSPVMMASSNVPQVVQDATTTISHLTISGIPSGQVVASLTATLAIQGTATSSVAPGDLRITLIAPDGTAVVLFNQRPKPLGGGETGLGPITFSDQATQSLAEGSPPYNGTFLPEDALAGMSGRPVNGTWTLMIEDLAPPFTGDFGHLTAWSLTVQPGTTAGGVNPGNLMDQNNDGIAGQPNLDAFAAPRPLNGVPFQLPYDQNTLPLIIPGPHVVSTFVTGNPTTPDNLVLNQSANSLTIVFDRDMNPATIAVANILRVVGPLGAITGPFTITADPAGTPAALAKRTFQIGFPTQTLSGTYTVQLGPTVQDPIEDTFGNAIDTNLNAGLEVLQGTDPTEATTTVNTFTNSAPVTIQPGLTVTSQLSISDVYQIVQNASSHIQLQLDITYQPDPNLSAQLIAPNGTTIQLFTGVGGFGAPPQANFQNTIFDDFAQKPDGSPNPIQLGSPPFAQGPFNPQKPLSNLIGLASNGVWTLAITNVGSQTGTLKSWSLSLPQAVPGTGLGETVADQIPLSFRIFVQDPTNLISQKAWTPVGPASENSGGNSGRIGGLAVDPSDPSGNTVYVAGASGGVWKTTDFLTTSPNGPTYIPLTDLGPGFSLNVGSIAVFGRNNDPNQSIIFVATGEGDTGTSGVGFLRSMDGGKTWQVLDSTVNVDAFGNILPMSSTARDHMFVGDTAFKVIVDPTALPNGQVAVYAALSGKTGGVWRSTDTGNTWQQVRKGSATDVLLAAGSRNNSGNLQILYAGFEGEGVYMTTSAETALTMSQMAGGQGVPLRVDSVTGNQLPVTAPAATPNGGNGRIVLATPVLTNNPLEDTLYQGWLYAVVVTSGGTLDGLFLTKDFGNNWTEISLPVFRPTPAVAYPTNDTSQPNYDPIGGGSMFENGSGQGNYDISLAIDPNNPNVVYIGGSNDGAPAYAGGFIRVDVTTIADPYALVAYKNSNPDGGKAEFATTGPVTVMTPGQPYGILDPNNPLAPPRSPYFDQLRDPDNPFLTPSTMQFANVIGWNNQGTGTGAVWEPLFDGNSSVLGGSTDQHRLLAVRDPLTGQTRLIIGDDQGVFTGVENPDGTLDTGIGSAASPTGSRNGNLQIIQFYYGASQPSSLAASIAGAMFYGMAQDNGFPVSAGNILNSGNLNWNGPLGDGTGVATDQTGSGQYYEYRWPCCGATPLPSDFFLVGIPNGPLVSRTTGLVQSGDNPATGAGEWPFLGGSNFAVNPIDPTGIIISSQASSPGPQIFRTFGPLTGTGVQWFVIAGSGDLDGTYAPALAFGAPNPLQPGVLDDFIYAGTSGGNIYVTFTGGGPGGWTKLSTGLDGSAVQQIVTDPLRGSHDAYAVTLNGVYYMPDSTAAKATWVKIDDVKGFGPLFGLTRPIFNNPNDPFPTLQSLTTIQADWRFAIPNKITFPNGPTTHPVLYVGGEGGVFRSIDQGQTWTFYPDVTADGAVQEGGLLPSAHVTELNLVLGNINPATGMADPSAGFNMLLATTYGRGDFVIRLNNSAVQQFLVAPNAGPHVTSVTLVSPNPGTQLTGMTVTFSGPVDPATFTPADVTVTGPSGQGIKVLSVDDVTPVGPGDKHNIYRINFGPQTQSGNYGLVLGPNISDFSGNLMDQDLDSVNGQVPDDQYSNSFSFSPNTAPTLSIIPNQLTVPNTPTAPIPFTVNDAQTGSNSVTLTATSSNLTLVPNANIVIQGTGANRTIVITPATNQTGTTTITLTATDPQGLSTSETFQLVVDTQPLLSAVNNQVAPHTQTSLSVQLTSTSPTKLPVTLRAEIFGYSKAYALKQQLGLFLDGSLFYNSFGQKDEWIRSSVQNKWYVLFPDGELKAWDGTPNSFATSPTVETLDPVFWQEPSLLYNASAPVAPVVTTSIDQKTQLLTITPPTGYTGTFQVTVTASDGFLTARESFLVTISDQAPVLSAIDNQTTTTGTAVKVQLNATDADSETPLLTATVSGYSQAYDLKQQLGLILNGSLFFNSFGQKEEWVFSTVQSRWYVILPTGALLAWDGTPHSLATSPQVAQLDPGIWQNPALLYNATAPVAPAGVTTSINQGTQVLTVTPPAGFTGTFRVTVAATDSVHTTQQSFLVLVSAPTPVVTLSAIGNQSIPHTQSSLSVQLNATDTSKNPLTLHADVFGYSTAYALKQQLGLFLDGSLFYNSFGQKDEWIRSSVQNKWYVLFPDGELKAWDGTPNSFATSPTVETLDPAFWQDPSLLYNASVPVAPAVTVSIDPKTQLMTITPPAGYTGTFQVTVSAADGSAADRKSFLVTVTDQAPVLAAINDQTVKHSNLPLTVNLSASDPNNDLQPLAATVLGYSQAYDLQRQLGLFVNGSLFFNSFGQREEWLFSSVQSKWYVILPDGELLQWDGTPNSLATSPLVARLSPSVWQNPSLLTNPAAPVAPVGVTASINQATQVLTINAPSGFTGIFRVLVSATDGIHTTQESFLVTVTK
jgi:subtilisin-like proprotein convertase family protein